MRLLFLTHYVKLYGANKSLLSLCDELNNRFELEVLLPSAGEMTEELKKRGIKYHIRPYISSFDKKKSFCRFIRRLGYLPRLIKLVWETKPDIIYTNTSVLDYGILMALIAQIPHIWHIREYGDKDYRVRYDGGKSLFRFLLSKSDALIVISKSLRDHLLKGMNSYVVYNGVSEKKHLETTSRNLSNQITFSIIGLVQPSKGQEIAIRSFSHLIKQNQKAQLIIAGKGSEEYTTLLKDLVKKEGIERYVHFIGYQKNIEEIYDKTDVLLMCSDFEAFGRVTAEAMSFGIPVIGRATGGTPEIISNNEDGLLFNTEAELCSQMKEIISNSKLYQKLSRNALKKTNELFSIKQYTDNLTEIIEEVYAKKS